MVDDDGSVSREKCVTLLLVHGDEKFREQWRCVGGLQRICIATGYVVRALFFVVLMAVVIRLGITAA